MNPVLERQSAIQIVPYEGRFLQGMLEVAKEIHAESLYRDMPLDEEKLTAQLASCGAIVPYRHFRLAVRGDEVYGGFYAEITKAFFCDQLIARDMGWWVKKSKRGSMAAILLLKDFEMWAFNLGAKKVFVGQSGEVDIEKTTRLYKHCGFRVVGYNTVKEF